MRCSIGIHALALFLAISATDTLAQNPFEGLVGDAILNKVSDTFRPVQPCSSVLGDNGIWHALNIIYGTDDAFTLDMFKKGDRYAQSADATMPPVGLDIIEISASQWWIERSEHQTAAWFDLYNLMPGNREVYTYKGARVPGECETVEYDNGTWKAGSREYYGAELGVFSPPKGLEGDFARIYMYMSCLYPEKMWQENAFLVFKDGVPGLEPYGKEILMKWHNADPVDEAEIARCRKIAEIQGNVNPFVTYTTLADYVWGDKAGTPFVPDEKRDRVAIKPSYSKANDNYLDFYSPYVIDADIVWTLDGEVVSTESIGLDKIAKGKHTIGFKGSQTKGKIIITVTE